MSERTKELEDALYNCSQVSEKRRKRIAEIEQQRDHLLAAIRQTLDANGHLADGEVCTLLPLKLALRAVDAPWDGDLPEGRS